MTLKNKKLLFIVIAISTSTIVLGLFVNKRYFKKITQETQNNSQTNLQPDCIIINKLSSKAVNQSISDQTIKEYFTQGLEYHDKIPLADKKFAINNLYPETNFEKNLLQIYIKALECKDKRIAKLLSEIDLLGGNTKAEWFDQNFEITWSRLAGKKIEPKGCNFDYSG